MLLLQIFENSIKFYNLGDKTFEADFNMVALVMSGFTYSYAFCSN